MVKAGRIYIEAVGISCPRCDEPCANPYNGSHMFGETDYRAGLTVTCTGCGMFVRCPASPWERKSRQKGKR